MIYCKRCILPSTRPSLEIGDDGICNACKSSSLNQSEDINWEKVYANGQVKKQTVGNLKKFLTARSHNVTGLKKDELVDKVNEILSDSCKTEM